MKNEEAVERLFRAADSLDGRSLDALACARAARWLTFMDAFGATLTGGEADALSTTERPAEIARSILRRLAKSDLPTPPEDAALTYLMEREDSGGGPRLSYCDPSSGPRPS